MHSLASGDPHELTPALTMVGALGDCPTACALQEPLREAGALCCRHWRTAMSAHVRMAFFLSGGSWQNLVNSIEVLCFITVILPCVIFFNMKSVLYIKCATYLKQKQFYFGFACCKSKHLGKEQKHWVCVAKILLIRYFIPLFFPSVLSLRDYCSSLRV